MKNRNKLMMKHFKKTNGHENRHMEELILADNENAIARAKEFVGIDNEEYSEPIVIVTPYTTTNRKVKFRTTKIDKTVRIDYDYALVNTIFLGERTLFYHQSAIDYLTGRVEKDLAIEVAYNDIVKTEVFIGYDNPAKPRLRVVLLNLSLVNGTVIDIPLRNHYLFESNLQLDLMNETEKYIINTIKKAIRTVK